MYQKSHRKRNSIDLESFTASGSRPLCGARSRDGGELGPWSVKEELQKRENPRWEEGSSWPWGVARSGLTVALAGKLQWRLGRRGTRPGWSRTRGGDSANFAFWTFRGEESRTGGMGRNGRESVGWWQERRVCSARALGGEGLGHRALLQGRPLSPARTSGPPEGPAADWAPRGRRSRPPVAPAEALLSASFAQRLRGSRCASPEGRRDASGLHREGAGSGRQCAADLGAASGCGHPLLLLLWRVWEARRVDLTAMGFGWQMWQGGPSRLGWS